MPKHIINHYIYWSERLTSQLMEELRSDPRPRWRLGLSAKIPPAGIEAQQRDYTLRRDEIADTIERSGIIYEYNPALPPPTSTPYILAGRSLHIAIVYSPPDSDTQYGAALAINGYSAGPPPSFVCFFGSLDNFVGYEKARTDKIEQLKNPRDDGWRVSTQQGIHGLLEKLSNQDLLILEEEKVNPMPQRLVRDVTLMDQVGIKMREDEAYKALQWVQSLMGNKNTARVLSVSDIDWCAQIYNDISLDPSTNKGNLLARRITIGSPLWIRSHLSGPV